MILIKFNHLSKSFYVTNSDEIGRCENVMTCPIRAIGSGSEHCPYDWLAVYDGRDEHSPLIGKFCGLGKFPFSIIGK